MAGGRALFDHGGVLLGGLVHLVHGHIDLFKTGGLLRGRGGDLGDDAIDLADLGDDPPQGLSGLADQINAGFDLLGRCVDQGLDLLGGLGRALGQGSHFLGDDREAATSLTRSRGFDAGVQRQKIGLEGDLVDHPDDVADLGRGLLDLAHGRDGLGHDRAAGLGVRLGHADHAAGLLGALGGALDGRGDLFQRRGRLLQTSRLLLGAPGHVVGGVGDLAAAGADAVGVADDHLHSVLQLGQGRIEVAAQLLVLGRQVVVDAIGQVAGGEAGEAHAERLDHQFLLLGDGLGGDGLALGLRAGLGVGGRGVGGQLGDGVLLEHLNGAGHLAQLILLAHSGNGDGVVAIGQAAHGAGHGLNRRGNLADHDVGGEGHQAGGDYGDDAHDRGGDLASRPGGVALVVGHAGLQVDQRPDTGRDRIDGGIELGVDEGLEASRVIGLQQPLQRVDGGVGGGKPGRDLVGQRLFLVRHLGGGVGLPVLGDRRLGGLDAFGGLGHGQLAGPRLVGAVDDVDRIHVADDLQLLHRLDAIDDDRLHALVGDAVGHETRKPHGKHARAQSGQAGQQSRLDGPGHRIPPLMTSTRTSHARTF